MRPTRRLLAAAALAVALAGLAVVLASPLPLVGAVLVAAWLVSRQLALADAVADLNTNLAVEQTVDDGSIRVGDTTEFTLSAAIPTPTPLAVTVAPGLPVATGVEHEPTVSLTGNRTEAWGMATLAWPVSGQHRFDPAMVTAGDGLFVETIETGTTPTVTVEPKGVRDVHVGAGGRRVAVAYGDHRTDRVGPGIEPATLREYAPGDPADWIAWKATARLPGTYVREFEVETDRGMWLVLDRRPSLAEGPPGHTKLDHLRTLALGLLQSARSADDPVGLLVVDGNGAATAIRPSTDPETHRAIRRRLLTVSPPVTDEIAADATARRHPVATDDARRHAANLEGDDTPFGRTLTSYFGEYAGYHRRIADRPLFGAVTGALADTDGAGLVAILTDDAAIAEVTETTKRARRADQDVLVCLTPSVLYEPDTDPEAAYDEYVAFEDHRRRLGAMGRVTAFEVGPRDRLGEILATGTRTRRRVMAR